MTPRKAFGLVLLVGLAAVAAATLLLDADGSHGHIAPAAQVAPWAPLFWR